MGIRGARTGIRYKNIPGITPVIVKMEENPVQCDNVQMNAYRTYVAILADPKASDEKKLRAAQEMSEHFEVVVQGSSYPSFLEHSLKAFMTFLQDSEPQFIQEYPAHQVSIFAGLVYPSGASNLSYCISIIFLLLLTISADNEITLWDN